ncbi:PRC-barrel domain-containing protein [Arenibaculum pallidiluteum]|uniref:PRC-barrel domain-containing protein n=1 Tax=Arenibaculum pallidiluteum TaxID=2812559 RepID=UPI001A97103E|nr:PRC-barrel domain-containing protein [Arenibaculum pallidiluteum]
MRTAILAAQALGLCLLPACGDTLPDRLGAGDRSFVLPDWKQPDPAGTLRARTLMGMAVMGPAGPVGQVIDLMVGPDERLAAVMVEGPAGQAAMPWAAVQAEGAVLRVAGPAGVPPATAPAASTSGGWSVAALLGDLVTFVDGQSYGTVEDVAFDPDGAVRTVVVRPDDPGAEAALLPFYGRRFGFEPGSGRYVLPFGARSVG